MRKRIATLGFAFILATSMPVAQVYASSLDDVVNGTQSVEQSIDQSVNQQAQTPVEQPVQQQPVQQQPVQQQPVQQQPVQQQPVQQPVQQQPVQQQPIQSGGSYGEVEDIANALGANNYLDVQSKEAVEAANTVNRWVTPFIQLMVYAITVLTVIRVLIDLLYVVFPPCRHILANGRIGNAASQGPANLGISGGGMNNYGLVQANSMNNAAINNAQAAGASTQIQWVSQAALNAVASESSVGPDGKANRAIKAYWKDMSVLLILTPILLVLAVTGILGKFGIFIANIIVGLIETIMKNV